jgi:hypothetical protein
MPLQGQWERQHTPIRALPERTRRTLAIVLGIIVLGTALTLYFTLSKSDASSAGCIDLSVPSTMGAGNIHACGQAAEKLCRGQLARSPSDPYARAAHAACRRAGYPAPATG